MKDLLVKKFALFAGMILLAGIFFVSPNHAEAKTGESTCKQMYEKYVELKEQKFREKYKGKSFVNDCMKMYKDSNWYFAGKHRIDNNYANLEKQMKNTDGGKIDVQLLSRLPIGTDKFLVKFRACADGSSVQETSFLIKSKMEQYVATTAKVLQKGKCNDYNTSIKAKQQSDIAVEYVPDVSKYPNIKSGPLKINSVDTFR